jgi:hypothetical protein
MMGERDKDEHMNKRETRQKLTLSRETLRRLESSQLAEVAGGSMVTCVPVRCTTGFTAQSACSPC